MLRYKRERESAFNHVVKKKRKENLEKEYNVKSLGKSLKSAVVDIVHRGKPRGERGGGNKVNSVPQLAFSAIF